MISSNQSLPVVIRKLARRFYSTVRPVHALIIIGIFLYQIPLSFAGRDYPNANHESYSGFSISEKAVLPASETHPKLWFDKNELLQLQKTFSLDAQIRNYWQRVQQHRYLTLSIPREITRQDGKKAIHKYYGDITQIALYNAFMVWLESDKAKREYYLNRAITALSRSYDGPIYEFDPRKDGIDKSIDEIYRGIWNQNLAAAYDFVQPFLSRQEDKLIRERLIREAAYTYTNLDSWAESPHNHLSKPAWGFASLALVLSEHPHAEKWLEKAIKEANRNTRYFFSADGIYREGAQYYLFSWLNFVPFLYHYKNISGVDLFNTFQPSLEWSLITRTGKGWLMNIEDSFIRPIPSQMLMQPYQNAQSSLNDSAPFSELLSWNFSTTDFSPFDMAEKSTGFNYTGASWDYPKALYELITYTPNVKSTPPNSDPTVFMPGGQTVFRNQWADDNNTQQYLLFHGVPHADNHDHNDQLSFILYAQSQIMASDQGYTRKGYRDPERTSWYRTAAAHNTLMLDNVPLGDFDENQPAPSSDRLNTTFFDFEQKSAPFRNYLDPKIGEAKRAIAYIQDDYFLILDTIETDRKRQASVYFHGGRSELIQPTNDTLKSESNFIWQYTNDQYGSSAKLLTRQFGHQIETDISRGESTYIKGDYQAFPYLHIHKQTKQTAFAQLLYPLSQQDKAPTINDLSTKKFLAATIQNEGFDDIFLKQNTRRKVKSGPIKTDATFTWVRNADSNNKMLAMQGGTKLAILGSTVIETKQPLSLALRYDDSIISGGFSAPEKTQVKLHLKKGQVLKNLYINNKIEKFVQKKNCIIFSLKGDGSLKLAL